MSFEHDIFISYGQIDNQPLGEGKGWIDNFFERLKVRLAQLIGEEPRIWWDGRLQGNEYFVGEIGDQISATLLLIPIISPRYVKSAWCRGELKEFCRRALQTEGLELRNRSRIFKVIKTPVHEEQQPEELSGLLGYMFYELDANDRPREFSPDVLPHKDQKYWAKLDDLAWDLKQVLEELKRQEPVPDNGQALMNPLEKKVYLAETPADLSGERDQIKRELQQRGYYVLPDRELPLSVPKFQDVVREHLARCTLSIHLIGESYGVIPDGEEESSIVRLQEELAAEKSADPDFSRLIWMPVGLKARGNRQQQFVAKLQTNAGAGAELLQTSLEDLKTRIVEKLSPQPKRAEQSTDANGLTRVYLMCDNRDFADVTPVEEFLFDQGYEVITSINEGDNAQVAQFHRESLLNCDATLIYYANANQLWLRSKLWDLQKAAGWGRTKPMRAKAIYVSGQATEEKKRLRTREVPLVMRNFPTFSPETLQPFIAAIKTGNGG